MPVAFSKSCSVEVTSPSSVSMYSGQLETTSRF